MTYVIVQPCVNAKDRACVDKCPIDCICEGARTLCINPLECVDYETCEAVCPTEAIFYEDNLSAEWGNYLHANRDLFDNIGTPGGVSSYGPVDKDDPMTAVLPPTNQ